MKKTLARILIALVFSPLSITGYIAAWIYTAFWIGWYWGIDNSTKLMGDKNANNN